MENKKEQIEKLDIEVIREKYNQLKGTNQLWMQILNIENKINELIEVVNKAHTCDCHRCPSEKL